MEFLFLQKSVGTNKLSQVNQGDNNYVAVYTNT